MANSPKDSPSASAEPCTLYYFPEIPCGMGKGREPDTTPGHFVSSASDAKAIRGSENTQPQDANAIASQIKAAFNKGFEQGRVEAIALQQEGIDQAKNALKMAMVEMTGIRQREVNQMETETVRLALAIAKKIIGKETEHGSLIGHVLQTAMQKVADPRHVTVRLNPKDVDTLKAFKGELLPDDDLGAVFRLEADEAIQQGGCIIETNLGDVDARIDQQVKIIEERLTAELPQDAAGG